MRVCFIHQSQLRQELCVSWSHAVASIFIFISFSDQKRLQLSTRRKSKLGLLSPKGETTLVKQPADKNVSCFFPPNPKIVGCSFLTRSSSSPLVFFLSKCDCFESGKRNVFEERQIRSEISSRIDLQNFKGRPGF